MAQTSTTQYFIWDNAPDGAHNVLLDFVQSGSSAPTLQHRYLDGAAVDQVFAQENVGAAGAGAVDWLIQDNPESVRDVLDNTGALVQQIDYDAFGNPTITDASGQAVALAAAATRFLFTGQEFDASTGLYWYSNGQVQGRWYDPKTGTFITQDPLGFMAGDTNLYRYVNNDPTNETDPTGRVSTARYIRGRVSLDNVSNTGSMRPKIRLDSTFDVAWNVNNAAFGKGRCKMCDEIGVIQIIRTAGRTDSWNPQIWALLNTKWKIDSIDSDMAYGQASEKFGGVVLEL